MHTRLVLKSRNSKTGPIPVSTTSSDTCPDACPLKSGGCYAKHGPLGMRWREVDGGVGDNWDAFTAQIATLPSGVFWRHNQAGDLPGAGDTINAAQLAQLVAANAGKRGFTYTHKPATAENIAAIRDANDNGFTVNLSANNLAHADALADTGAGPVVVVLDAREGTRADTVTPAGRRVVTCPATYRDDTTCRDCQLCQRQRDVIVGFPANGAGKRAAARVARDA